MYNLLFSCHSLTDVVPYLKKLNIFVQYQLFQALQLIYL